MFRNYMYMYHPPGVNIHPLREPGHWLTQELCSGGDTGYIYTFE